MKRMSFILFSTLTIGALTACGQGEDPNTGNDNAGSNEVNESTENSEEAESGNMAEASNSAEENSNTENNSNAQNNESEQDNAENNESENASNNNGAENEPQNNDSSSEESAEENDSNNTNSDSDAEEASEEESNSEENNASDNSSNNSSNHDNETEENAGNNAEADEEAALVSPLYLYFSDDQLLTTYKVEADHSVSKDEAGAMEAMELWAAGPSEETLYGLLPEGASVQSVELEDEMAYVSLSPDVKDANLGSTGEGMLTDHIAMMMEQFGASQTMILIDGEETSDFLGHLDLSRPIEADSPDNYEEY
ncbi:GerMN domain-containing protein [Alkalicoccus halolimnae]|uniref:GerMN domain-containing protein n=1 Tax=Alkalicoccus halolimnae TaxID=1667239 RepID=A0A5C7FGQ7_9BACI|nr:GerMN domain-containing protein [Alkalicoccus halolimnae]TXF83953.1 GerMN domain-containing protein [Alkalicoccus halolimnae]